MEEFSIGAAAIWFALDQLNTFLGAVYGGVMASYANLARLITAIYIAVVGYMILMGRFGEKSQQWAASIFVLPIISEIIFEPALYDEWIVRPFGGVVLELSGFLARGDEKEILDVIGRMDIAIGRILHAVDNINVSGNILTEAWEMTKAFIASTLVAVVFIGLYLVFVVLYIQAFIGMYLMFLAGGIALFFAIFKETRFITWAWLRALFTNGLWAIFLGAIVGLGIQGVEGSAVDIANWNPDTQGIFTRAIGISLAWGCMLIYALLKCGDYAAWLTGGAAPQAGGLIGSAAFVAGGAIMTGTRTLHSAAGGWTGLGRAGIAAGRGITGVGIRAWSAMRGFIK